MTQFSLDIWTKKHKQIIQNFLQKSMINLEMLLIF
jgi:hypothetical protein